MEPIVRAPGSNTWLGEKEFVVEGIKGSKIDGEARVPRSFGIATLVLVTVAIVLVGAALLLATRRPIAVSAPVVAAPTPWQPEPSYLLQHAGELALTPGQTRHMKVVIRDWELKKGAYDVQLRRFQKSSDQALADLASSTRPGGDYGKVLASLEKDRNAAWERAVAPLSPGQYLKLQAVRVPPVPAKH